MKIFCVFVILFIKFIDCSYCYSLYFVKFKNNQDQIDTAYFVVNPDSNFNLEVGKVEVKKGLKAYKKISITKDVNGDEMLVCKKPVRLSNNIEVLEIQWIKDFYYHKK